jgi:hypothetical protein
MHSLPGLERRPRRTLVWALVLRVCALFLFAELSGVPHALIDVVEACGGSELHAQEDCGDEEAGHECPPGCPNCHCFHAAAAAPALLRMETELVPLLRRTRHAGFVPYVGKVPPSADLDALYRPPRAHA